MTAKVQSRDKSECLEKRSITARLGDFVKNEKETLSQRDYIKSKNFVSLDKYFVKSSQHDLLVKQFISRNFWL